MVTSVTFSCISCKSRVVHVPVKAVRAENARRKTKYVRTTTVTPPQYDRPLHVPSFVRTLTGPQTCPLQRIQNKGKGGREEKYEQLPPSRWVFGRLSPPHNSRPALPP